MTERQRLQATHDRLTVEIAAARRHTLELQLEQVAVQRLLASAK